MIKSFSDFINEGFNADTPSGNDLGNFALKLLAARDQAHIFHWQTKSYARHEAFGEFYEDFLTNVDDLVESIMGIIERPSFGQATITLKDYSEGAIAEFFERLYRVINEEIKIVIDPMHEEIYDLSRVITSQIDKLKYLLSLS
jgi:DNA-binding ferritin-like protein